MPTILVTGGAGFIGSCLIRQLVGNPENQVINFDKLTYAGNLDSLRSVESAENYHFIQADITDRDAIEKVLGEFSPSLVANLAAESHVDRSIEGPATFLQTNVCGTFELLDASLHHWQQLPTEQQDSFRFLHVSTDEVYGSLGDEGKFQETSPYQPNSPYSASKAASDHFVRAYYHTFGLPTLITNCSNNYGPYQFPEKLIPLMILNAREGKPLPIYGDGQNVRDWLHVEDHCHALELVLTSGRIGEVYNIGGNCEKTNLEMVEQICRTVEQLATEVAGQSLTDLITFVPDRPGHDRRYAIDSSKIESELGFQPRHDLESGLQNTVQWYLDHADWIEGIRSGGYRGQRLGLGRTEGNEE
ncbi:MAG: dTDP-glucose 4,6-dehydratase [Planctomycetaceae bacterium]|nr:dTDP-glucose 4,6-dehydratase [Planctomycetaceae bacterium]